jgi:putative methionine-R-sulfoxide reductase with GAF domain
MAGVLCAAAASKISATIVTDEKKKLALDEQAFGKLLEAAYVLQEHNRERRKLEERLELQSELLRQQETETQAALERSPARPAETRPDTDYTRTLAEIVEAQHQIQIRHLESEKAMALVAERTARISGASGAGIGIQEGKMIRYLAGAGAAALPVGSAVPLETAICAICVRTGQVLRTPDVNTEFLFDPEMCHPRGIQSLAAVPIYHDGNIVGALELYFDKPQGFVEQDIHTCRLMAGLVTEAIGRSSESELKKSMAEERSTMMAAIEQLNLQPLADVQTQPAVVTTSTVASGGPACWKCGSKLIADEQFCGKCGAPSVTGSEQAALRSKMNFALPAHLGNQNSAIAPPNGNSPPADPIIGVGARLSAATHEIHLSNSPLSPKFETNVDSMTADSAVRADEEAIQTALSIAAQHRDIDVKDPAAALLKAKSRAADWGSAAKARDFLETMADTPTSGFARFWRAHRGDFYLGVAILLVLIALRWGIFSGSSVGATGGNTASPAASQSKPPAPDANLSTFDRLLISLGLAEAPETPTTEEKGNPDVQVWIDLHTALYYCAGSDLYGKTPKGRFATQRDAQLDQFESASRKACE